MTDELRSCWATQTPRPEWIADPRELEMPTINKRNPGSGMFTKGLAIYKTKWWEKALKTLRESVARYDKCPEAWFYIGVTLYKAEKPVDERLEAYKKCLSIDPEFGDALYNYGWILQNVKHDLEGAEAAYRKMLEFRPNCSDASLNLALLLKTKGDGEADAVFARAVETADLPDEQPVKAVVESPLRRTSMADMRRSSRRSRASMNYDPRDQQQQLPVAAPKPRDEAKVEPVKPPGARPSTARSRKVSIVAPVAVEPPAQEESDKDRTPLPVIDAQTKRKNPKFRSMEAIPRAAAEQQRVTFSLGGVEDNSNEGKKPMARRESIDESMAFRKAKKNTDEDPYKDAILQEPANALNRVKYGSFLFANNHDYNGAEREYRAAIGVEPSCSEAYYNLAVLLDTIRHDYDGAEAAYQQCLSIEPDHVACHNNLAVLLEEVKKDIKLASKHFKAALDLDPDDADIRQNYMRCLRKRRHST